MHNIEKGNFMQLNGAYILGALKVMHKFQNVISFVPFVE